MQRRRDIMMMRKAGAAEQAQRSFRIAKAQLKRLVEILLRGEAILDWEMAHFGDFHDDLGGVIVRMFGHLDERGEFLVSGLMPRQRFLDEYARLSGRSINPSTLHFYEILNNYKSLVIILATAYRVAVEQHNHQNVLQTWLVPCAHGIIAEICRQIDEGYRP